VKEINKETMKAIEEEIKKERYRGRDKVRKI